VGTCHITNHILKIWNEHMPVVPVTQEAKVGGSLKLRSLDQADNIVRSLPQKQRTSKQKHRNDFIYFYVYLFIF
jgi:hypothetical protein